MSITYSVYQYIFCASDNFYAMLNRLYKQIFIIFFNSRIDFKFSEYVT